MCLIANSKTLSSCIQCGGGGAADVLFILYAVNMLIRPHMVLVPSESRLISLAGTSSVEDTDVSCSSRDSLATYYSGIQSEFHFGHFRVFRKVVKIHISTNRVNMRIN